MIKELFLVPLVQQPKHELECIFYNIQFLVDVAATNGDAQTCRIIIRQGLTAIGI